MEQRKGRGGGEGGGKAAGPTFTRFTASADSCKTSTGIAGRPIGRKGGLEGKRRGRDRRKARVRTILGTLRHLRWLRAELPPPPPLVAGNPFLPSRLRRETTPNIRAVISEAGRKKRRRISPANGRGLKIQPPPLRRIRSIPRPAGLPEFARDEKRLLSGPVITRDSAMRARARAR